MRSPKTTQGALLQSHGGVRGSHWGCHTACAGTCFDVVPAEVGPGHAALHPSNNPEPRFPQGGAWVGKAVPTPQAEGRRGQAGLAKLRTGCYGTEAGRCPWTRASFAKGQPQEALPRPPSRPALSLKYPGKEGWGGPHSCSEQQGTGLSHFHSKGFHLGYPLWGEGRNLEEATARKGRESAPFQA